jgi:hypothetical protein
MTGPITGTVTLEDGTEVDVSPDFAMVDSPEQAAEVAHLIALRYQGEGHPGHDADHPFVYQQEG